MQLRIIFLITTCFLFMAGNAQTLGSLQISNPAPRVGDFIDVKVLFTLPVTGSDEENKFASEMKISAPAASGNVWIGPFTFKINGQEYTTDSVSIHVAEKRPEKDSLIIRQVTFSGNEYLVVEQMIKNKSKKQEFVELKHTKLAKGLKLDNTMTSSTTGGSIGYQVIVYKIFKENTYEGGAIITRNDIDNLPKNILFDRYIIQ